ncbi:hypothetical protein [Roseibium sediminicola]|uniref:Uncharacterized protein n=1 Tax=Roseibium sediminicola TaxID=2933272 RepID=A0ABT0GUY6_9HYPH|nr:hypothetical protein [Roseibium sp. CAU 1639]MCK7612643.1 hypothetical protein [Roseibium sp. CAU 1639]
MSQAETPNSRGKSAHKSDLHEARPLLQAILLGIVLATALVAAAVMANPSNAANAHHRPVAESQVPGPTSGK